MFALSWLALLASHNGRRPDPPFPHSQLRSALLANPPVARYLHARHWSSVRGVPLDQDNWRVTVLDGPRAILDATVGADGEVSAASEHPTDGVPIGSHLLWTPGVLLLLTVIFCAVLAVVPLRSMRNVDALVLGAGFYLELELYNHRLVAPHIVVATIALAYVAARMTFLALRPSLRAGAQRPLFVSLAHRIGATPARRLGALGMTAVVVLGATLIFTSTGISDIALVNLAGATVMKNAQLPYGNFPPALGHGDTYPLFSYVLFLPGALFSPVSDYFDDLQSALDINLVAYLAVALLLWRTGARAGQSRVTGLLAAAAWLAFPANVFAGSTGGNDVPTAAFVALGLFAWTRPGLSAAALALAGWAKVVPAVALLTQSAHLRGQRLVRATVGVGAVCGAAVILLLALGGSGGIRAMLDAMRFQTDRGSLHSIWWQLDALGAQQVFEAATLGLIAAIGCAIALRSELRRLQTAAAASAAAVALVQLAGNYWNATYLAWLMPLVLVALFVSSDVSAGDASADA